MPNEQKLFAVTQWVLKAAIVATIAMMIAILISSAAILYAWQSGLVAVWLANAAREAAQIGDATMHVGGWNAQLSAAAIAELTPADLVSVIFAGIVGTATLLVLVRLILRAFLRVVASASVGDPFNAQNADDIVRTAWLLLGFYAAQILMAFGVYSVSPKPMRMLEMHNFGVPYAGLLAVLLMFVLARIFRRGTEMRAELEGTV